MERKRVTKYDKKNDRQVYSQKHVRILLKQIEASKLKRVDGSLHAADRALLPDELRHPKTDTADVIKVIRRYLRRWLIITLGTKKLSQQRHWV